MTKKKSLNSPFLVHIMVKFWKQKFFLRKGKIQRVRKKDAFEEIKTATCSWLGRWSTEYICIFNLHLAMIFKYNYAVHTEDSLFSIVFPVQYPFCYRQSYRSGWDHTSERQQDRWAHPWLIHAAISWFPNRSTDVLHRILNTIL